MITWVLGGREKEEDGDSVWGSVLTDGNVVDTPRQGRSTDKGCGE